jgi:hypothetical protein
MPDRITLPPSAITQRPTEASDARLHLPEHDQDLYKRQEEDAPHDPLNPQDIYDQAILGVLPLIDFLTNFVRTYNVQTGVHTDTSSISSPQNTIQKQDISQTSPAARAASAYAHTAHTAQTGQDAPASTATLTADPSGQPIDLDQIKRVIQKLRQLHTKGVEGLRLYRARSFVQSIETAADEALNHQG